MIDNKDDDWRLDDNWWLKDVEKYNPELLRNESVKEAVSALDKERKKSVFDKVLNELSPDHPDNFRRTTKFKGVELEDRYPGDLTNITRDGYIKVFGKDEAALNFAKQVSDYYNCSFDGPHKSAQYIAKQNPDFAFYAIIKTGEE